MKKRIIFATLALVAALTGLSAIGSTEESSFRLDITVDYERQAGRGSNQYAVWIEDMEGNLVKTLYVTRFTGEGGYIPRPDCVPRWVAKAGSPSKQEADAYTGATPQSGKHIYSWDGTDTAGIKVPGGQYRFVVEATYLGRNIVVFENTFETGNRQATIPATGQFNSDEQQNRRMIKSVSAHYVP